MLFATVIFILLSCNGKRLAFDFRYEMSNCLFEGAYEVILKQCNCTPGFHLTGFASVIVCIFLSSF